MQKFKFFFFFLICANEFILLHRRENCKQWVSFALLLCDNTFSTMLGEYWPPRLYLRSSVVLSLMTKSMFEGTNMYKCCSFTLT